MHSLCVELSGL